MSVGIDATPLPVDARGGGAWGQGSRGCQQAVAVCRWPQYWFCRFLYLLVSRANASHDVAHSTPKCMPCCSCLSACALCVCWCRCGCLSGSCVGAGGPSSSMLSPFVTHRLTVAVCWRVSQMQVWVSEWVAGWAGGPSNSMLSSQRRHMVSSAACMLPACMSHAGVGV